VKLEEKKKLIVKERVFVISGVAIVATLFFAMIFIIYSMGSGYQEPKVEIQANNNYEKTLVVAADWDYDPYTFYTANGEKNGHDIELMNAIANRLEVNVEFRLMSWLECEYALLNGDVDVVMGMDINKDRNRHPFLYSIPIQDDQFVCFGKKDIKTTAELLDKRLAAIGGSGAISNILETYKVVDNIEAFSSYTEAFRSVLKGKNDYVICRLSVGRRIASKLGNTSIQQKGPILSRDALCIAVNQDNPQLLNEINIILREFTEDHTIDMLSEKWLGTYVLVTHWTDYFQVHKELILASGIAMLIAIMILGYEFYKSKAILIQTQYDLAKRHLEYEKLLNEATKGLYENIFEADLTKDRPLGEFHQYLKDMGLSDDISYSEALKWFVKRQIHEDFTKGHMELFQRDKAIKAFEDGKTSFSYEMKCLFDEENYYWMRVTARLFFWETDKSIRLITYCQNIDLQRRREQKLLYKAQRDDMTGLYNKGTTETLVGEFLKEKVYGDNASAMLMVDADNFKNVNDYFGHSFGDFIIKEIARNIGKMAAEEDIVGRVGGDEFLVFIKSVKDQQWLEDKLKKLNHTLCQEYTVNGRTIYISASIGVVLTPPQDGTFEELYRKADQALYVNKSRGKNSYCFYAEDFEI